MIFKCTDTQNMPAPAEEPEIYCVTKELAGRIAAALDDRQLAAQVIITGIDGKGTLPLHMQALLTECPTGGIMLFRYNLDTDTEAIQNLLAETVTLIASESVIPFAGVDHEGGTVNRFRRGVADMPSAASYWEIAENEGKETALMHINTDSVNAGLAIKHLGINMNFAPVAEHLTEDNYDFLQDRSYGPDPVFAAEAAGAFITGMNQTGVLCVIKHFPGSAGTDPHYFSSVLPGDRDALTALAAPFAALIEKGLAQAIMISHSAVPALDNEHIASLSPVVMDEWLRQELGFAGIIICDDFSMAAASSPPPAGGKGHSPEAAAVRSLIAGADMVLVWPPDLRRTHNAIQAALADGTLPRERLQEAAERIILEKIQMGLISEE